MGRKRRVEDRQADAETLWYREQVAKAARAQLAVTGLPVQPDGLSAGAMPGAFVHVDHREQVTEVGVYLGWNVTPVLGAAVEQDDPETEEGARMVTHCREVVVAMTEAMRTILTSAGFSVGMNTGLNSWYTLYITGVPSGRWEEPSRWSS